MNLCIQQHTIVELIRNRNETEWDRYLSSMYQNNKECLTHSMSIMHFATNQLNIQSLLSETTIDSHL